MSFYPISAAAATNGEGDTGVEADDEQYNFFGFFGDLLVPEEQEREQVLLDIRSRLMDAARTVEGSSAASADQTPEKKLLAAHLPSVLRLALACPLPDISSSMRSLLQDLSGLNPLYGKYVQALDFAFQPSSFIPKAACVQVSNDDSQPTESKSSNPADGEDARNLLEDIFLSTGRLSYMDLLMAWHPSYLTQYASCTHYIMEESGPLQHTWRNYLAIMAASRHHCDYLISMQETEFLLKGGDPTWLKGIAYAPKKLQSLCDLNALLAHQPWLITKHHISTLVHNPGTDSWNLAELVHALVILSTFHAFSGFVFGMGLNKEIDSMDWSSWEPAKNQTPAPLQRKPTQSSNSSSSGNVLSPTAGETTAPGQVPAALLKDIQAAQQTHSPAASTTTIPKPSTSSSASSSISDGEHLLRLLTNQRSEDEMRPTAANAFNAAVEDLGTSPAQESSFVTKAATAAASTTPVSTTSSVNNALANAMRSPNLDWARDPANKFLAVPTMDPPNSAAAQMACRIATLRYSNFDVNSKAYSIFFLHDYSWKEHGYALVNRYYQGKLDNHDQTTQGVAQMLDAEWDLIFSLTYNTVSGQQNIDTTPFRRAVWYFTQRLFGLQHDDYNYNGISIYLTNSLKNYIKKIVCHPETITESDYQLNGYFFKPDEKCHIALLAVEARRQASLLYALNSVMKYMVGSE